MFSPKISLSLCSSGMASPMISLSEAVLRILKKQEEIFPRCQFDSNHKRGQMLKFGDSLLAAWTYFSSPCSKWWMDWKVLMLIGHSSKDRGVCRWEKILWSSSNDWPDLSENILRFSFLWILMDVYKYLFLMLYVIISLASFCLVRNLERP